MELETYRIEDDFGGDGEGEFPSEDEFEGEEEELPEDEAGEDEFGGGDAE